MDNKINLQHLLHLQITKCRISLLKAIDQSPKSLRFIIFILWPRVKPMAQFLEFVKILRQKKFGNKQGQCYP